MAHPSAHTRNTQANEQQATLRVSVSPAAPYAGVPQPPDLGVGDPWWDSSHNPLRCTFSQLFQRRSLRIRPLQTQRTSWKSLVFRWDRYFVVLTPKMTISGLVLGCLGPWTEAQPILGWQPVFGPNLAHLEGSVGAKLSEDKCPALGSSVFTCFATLDGTGGITYQPPPWPMLGCFRPYLAVPGPLGPVSGGQGGSVAPA